MRSAIRSPTNDSNVMYDAVRPAWMAYKETMRVAFSYIKAVEAFAATSLTNCTAEVRRQRRHGVSRGSPSRRAIRHCEEGRNGADTAVQQCSSRRVFRRRSPPGMESRRDAHLSKQCWDLHVDKRGCQGRGNGAGEPNQVRPGHLPQLLKVQGGH